MIRDIMRDPIFLQEKSEPATARDKHIIDDLVDTLRAHQENCVGLAANMIGEKKQIIAVMVGPFIVPMVNPIITKKSGEYMTEESCLSLEGTRPCIRFREIEVDYFDQNFEPQHGVYTDFVAEIIQHEIQHFDGVLI